MQKYQVNRSLEEYFFSFLNAVWERDFVVLEDYIIKNDTFCIRPYSEKMADVPNFEYFPSGLKIWWYKHPLREAESNQELTTDKFLEILDKCRQSTIKNSLSKFLNINDLADHYNGVCKEGENLEINSKYQIIINDDGKTYTSHFVEYHDALLFRKNAIEMYNNRILIGGIERYRSDNGFFCIATYGKTERGTGDFCLLFQI